MRILVTGADGFLGRGLVARLMEAFPEARQVVLTDRAFGEPPLPGAGTVCGDLAEAGFLADLLETGFDLVFHLASLPGALAEKEQELGHAANLLVPLALARTAAARKPGCRFVFASSIAVYGDLAGRTVTPDTPTAPDLTYGAHKRMTEILLSDLRRRCALSAVSLRFPGIVARPASESGHGSAFMSLIFHRVAAGEAYDCPVPADSHCWWMSRRAAVAALLHAARAGGDAADLVQPPVLHASVDAVAQAVARLAGRPADIRWVNDEGLRRIFGAMPPLDAALALSLGFRGDADLDTLAQAALSGD
ncbi:NAD-dependent epimerase/dehydratase family protein [Rhizobium sp. CSW-27]|uniref:NAD-dependent epimerase/dehydratase family protein n=1 Tax=Rhizobium sp. CSW-27 TaxID=2839985 RepID=UPI001C02D9F5|nr:NAD-dependent epimerase/dehydratase family protein [Rhizobium sp. CSW-27]MBT9371327.1 NAD-dependent epimerase/dehydratase family protein [Rhizobium sp. CSW-27]